MKKKKYYAYRLPNGKTGILDDWKDCEKLVSGVNGARYMSFGHPRDAEAWLKAGAAYEAKSRSYAKLEKGIYFDAGTGRGDGVEVSVTDEAGRDLLGNILKKSEINKFGKHLVLERDATNNYGELLALKYALMIAEKLKVKKIFGDSKLVIEYWSQWRMKRSELPLVTVELARSVAAMREGFEKNGGRVERISGDVNPADLGFH
jgi:ribonuclease HI